MSRLAIDVRCAAGTATVAPAGEVELATCPDLDATIRDLRGRCRKIEIDLGDVTFIDSTGIRLLLTTWRETSNDGVDLSILPGRPVVMRAFAMTGLIDKLPFSRASPT